MKLFIKVLSTVASLNESQINCCIHYLQICGYFISNMKIRSLIYFENLKMRSTNVITISHVDQLKQQQQQKVTLQLKQSERINAKSKIDLEAFSPIYSQVFIILFQLIIFCSLNVLP